MSGFDLPAIGDLTQRLLPQGEVAVPERAPLLGEDAAPGRGGDAAAAPFGGLLADAIDRTASLQHQVRDQTEAMLMGEPVAMHDIMLAMGKSEVAFNLMLEVRNKLVEAWEKLSRSVM
jgi:flagellar hook-basal body complex protein FliE